MRKQRLKFTHHVASHFSSRCEFLFFCIRIYVAKNSGKWNETKNHFIVFFGKKQKPNDNKNKQQKTKLEWKKKLKKNIRTHRIIKIYTKQWNRKAKRRKWRQQKSFWLLFGAIRLVNSVCVTNNSKRKWCSHTKVKKIETHKHDEPPSIYSLQRANKKTYKNQTIFFCATNIKRNIKRKRKKSWKTTATEHQKSM